MQYITVGIGGQGILFASKVLGQIALEKNQKVIGSEVHGMSQRGGSVISHYKIGDYSGPMVQEGCADVMLAFDFDEAVRNLAFLREGGTLVVNCDDPSLFENGSLGEYTGIKKIKVKTIDGFDILRKNMEGRFLFLNVVILGALCGAGVGNVSFEDVKTAVTQLSPKRFKDDNLKALDLGLEAVTK